jgi:hypothetical protein
MNIDDLKSYYESLSEEEREDLENEGAFLMYPPVESGYDSDPDGFVAFMSTGGDGVHYNLPKNSKDGKIVMNVPMNFGKENLVLGDTLFEFLSLGCDFGYFSLEQLTYNISNTIKKIHNAQPESDALIKLKKHFNLKPWSNIEDRLLKLNGKA